ALARAAAARLGVDLPEAAVGGASDGNFAAALGRPVLDGLGAVGGGAHARHEHVSVDGMVERAAVAAAVVAAFAGWRRRPGPPGPAPAGRAGSVTHPPVRSPHRITLDPMLRRLDLRGAPLPRTAHLRALLPRAEQD